MLLRAYWRGRRPSAPHLADIHLPLDALLFAPIVITVAFETTSFRGPGGGPILLMTIPADFNFRNIYIGRQLTLRDIKMARRALHHAVRFMIELCIREPPRGDDCLYKGGKLAAGSFRRDMAKLAILLPQ